MQINPVLKHARAIICTALTKPSIKLKERFWSQIKPHFSVDINLSDKLNAKQALLSLMLLCLTCQASAADAVNASVDPNARGASCLTNACQAPAPVLFPVSGAPVTTGAGNVAACSNGTGATGCESSEIASQSNQSQSNLGAGNPINVTTGNKYQREEDLPALPGSMGIEIVRHYNSLHMGLGQMGYGWRLSYETELQVSPTTLQIMQADGSRIIFNRSLFNPSDCACQNPAQGHVMIYHTPRGDEYTWYWTNGKQLHFNRQGKLERITSATGESVHLTRGLRGELLKVTDPQGRSLVMHYADKRSTGFRGIIAIDSPIGRFSYQHNNDRTSPGISNLEQVSYPAAAQNKLLTKIYHYGEPDYVHPHMSPAQSTRPQIPHAAHLLTGISLRWHAQQGSSTNKDQEPTSQRLRTWKYDALGRGILSAHGTPNSKEVSQQVNISYRVVPLNSERKANTLQAQAYPRITHNGQIGQTILTNSLGQTTTYNYTLIAGEYRLLQVIGAGCAECGESNIVYGYDTLGRQTDITNVALKHNPNLKTTSTLPNYTALSTTRTQYDQAGRVVQISRIGYQDGQAQPAQVQVRYSYASTPSFPQLKQAPRAAQEPVQVFSQPSLIAKPGVIKGKEHQWHITYNDHGQPLTVTETGYAPALPTAQSPDKASAPRKISRTTTYQYSNINSRSLLTSVDGPLPNGNTNTPQDSDITQYQYDKLGRYLTKVTAPNNIITKLEYDLEGAPTAKADAGGTGRVIVSTLNDGARQIQTNISYSNNPESLNQATQITRTAWLLDANGQLDTNSSQTLAVLEAVYDVHGKRILHKGSDGEQTMTYNEAGQPVTLTNNQGESLNWAYDAQVNPLAQVTADAKGKVIDGRMWLRDEADQLRAVLSPKGVEHMVVNMSAPQKTSTQTAGVSQISKNNSQSKGVAASALARIKLRDDFGRTVYEQHPEDGAIITTFNPVNDAKQGSGEIQTQTRISLDGQHKQVETLHFSFTGQLLTRERSADGEVPCKDTLEYEGKLLQSLNGCGGEQTFERNAFGQIITQTQTVYPAKQKMAGTTFAQQFSYDNAGKLISRTLPTQQVLNYGDDAIQNSSQTQSIQLQRSWLTRLANLTSQNIANRIANTLPKSWTYTSLISQVQKQPFNQSITALQSVQHGNGSTTTWINNAAQQPPARNNNAVPLWVKVSAALNAKNSEGEQINKANITQTNQAINLDSFGRLTQYTPSTGTNIGKPLTLQWNAANQLMAVLDASTQKPIARYGYDTTGNRVSKTIYTKDALPQTTYYAYDNAHKLIAESRGGNEITRQYLYLDHRLHSLIEGNDIYAVSTDWRGLPQSVTDKTQQTVWAREMDAWGNLIHKKILKTPQRIADLNIRLAGQYYDAETGLHYNIHRYFNPQTHQYISPDPLGTPDGNNRYAYLNGNPNAGIDPLGLFEVPTEAFLGNNSVFNSRAIPVSDEGHGDIVRIAFAQYNAENGMRFSQIIIEQIILNNYHSDANGGLGCYFIPNGYVSGGGQCNKLNHFDNPNQGSMYNIDGTKKTNYQESGWIQASFAQIKQNRELYNAVNQVGATVDISPILNAFGQNTHAIADFYAHTNWVDATTRGGCYNVPISKNGQLSYLPATVPKGLNSASVWNEDPNIEGLYSGTVASVAEVKTATTQYNSHAYWNKDSEKTDAGKQLVSNGKALAEGKDGLFFWKNTTYDPKNPPKNELIQIGKDGEGNPIYANGTFGEDYFTDTGLPPKTGERIYVREIIENRHELAFALAIEHTKLEIVRLYQAQSEILIANGLQNIFKMNDEQLKETGISGNRAVIYENLRPKD